MIGGVDFVSRLIQLLETTPPDRWESTLRTELHGRHYVACATGRAQVQALIQAGCRPRTARRKVYDR